MKRGTYSLRQYEYGDGRERFFRDTIFCPCVRGTYRSEVYYILTMEGCKNCLELVVPPIPLSEVPVFKEPTFLDDLLGNGKSWHDLHCTYTVCRRLRDR